MGVTVSGMRRNPAMSTPLVTLTTDFGTRDPYVAAMKGVMYTILPCLAIADLTHEIAPGSVLEGALFLANALPFFPERTVHVAVVDPGVGTDRRAIILEAGNRYLVCPDNGLATCYARRFPLQDARVIENPEFIRTEVSATFHGRDVFAPVAAHLAGGVPLHEFGPALSRLSELPVPVPRISEGRIDGEIIHVDRFGNLVTNIPETDLRDRIGLRIQIGPHHFGRLCRTYADVSSGEPLALIGSGGYLEVAVNGDHAGAALEIGVGHGVVVEL